MVSRVSERSQITIEPHARKLLGVRPGMIAYQRVVSGHLEVVFLPAPHHESLAGVLKIDGREPLLLTRDEMERAMEEAVAAQEEVE